MKKLLVGALVCALLLSLCGVTASALTVEEIEVDCNFGFCQGEYSGAAEDFSALGTVGIDWDPAVSAKLNVTDGDMADWANAGYNSVLLTPDNMINWGGLTDVPEGWSVYMYFVADPDNLYMGFYITDPVFAYGEGSRNYSGDAIQLAIDFGGKMGNQLRIDPEVLPYPKNIFYSFSCDGDGAPLMIMRQESDQDGFLTEEDGVKGSTSKTAEGWCAEFSMSWDRLFEDYAWKAWDDDAKIYVGSDEKLPLNIGLCLYYLDRSETSGAINWAAGSTNGITYADGSPAVSWTAWDNGIRLELDYEDGMYFNCGGIRVIHGFETTAPPLEETTEEFVESVEDDPAVIESLPPVEIPTEPAIESGTFPEPDTDEETTRRKPNYDDDDDDDDDRNRDDEIDAILAKYGCGAVVSAGGMLVLPLLAAAFVFRKKS